MSATNKTTNYELPVFIGTDKPAWLVDWNGAMNAIDTAIKQAETKADTAGVDIGSIQSDIITINSALTTLNGAVSQLRIDTNANTGAINTIQELIGNGTPTTTDHTIIGAINEINAYLQFGQAHTGTITPESGFNIVSTSAVYSVLDSDKKYGKIYGGVVVSGTYTIQAGNNVIATLSNLALPTIDESYDIVMGTWSCRGAGASADAPTYMIAKLRFMTDGTVKLILVGATTGAEVNLMALSLPPCVLQLTDLGD